MGAARGSGLGRAAGGRGRGSLGRTPVPRTRRAVRGEAPLARAGGRAGSDVAGAGSRRGCARSRAHRPDAPCFARRAPAPGQPRGLASVWVRPCARDAARRARPAVLFILLFFFFRMTTSGALFPSLVPGSRGSSTKYLVEFRAGKMSLKGTTVTPDKRKGLVYIQQTDDSLIHFCWKDRTSGTVEDVSPSAARALGKRGRVGSRWPLFPLRQVGVVPKVGWQTAPAAL